MTGHPQRAFVLEEIDGLRDAVDALRDPALLAAIERAADAVCHSVRQGGKTLFCGNGGSAADAQHLAAEMVGRQNYDRPPAAGLALTVDSSALTAIGNDYGFDYVFARQVEALGRPGDVLVGLSTSGRSRNVVAAFESAKAHQVRTIALTGRDPRDMSGADIVLAVPADATGKIQELHGLVGHIIFAIVERTLHPRPSVG